MPPPTERAFVATPDVRGGGRVISSPFQFYTTGEDSLRLRLWSSLTSTIVLAGRWLRTNGEVHAFRHTFITTADRLPNIFEIQIDPGFLLNCSLGADGSQLVGIGQTFAQLQLVRGRGDSAIEMGTVIQGYVATSHWLAFPGSPVQHSLEGPGRKQYVTFAQPVAGAEVTGNVPEHALWRIYSVYTIFQTNAVAANRFPQLCCFTGTVNAVWKVQAPFAMGALQGFNFFWTPGVQWTPAATQIPNGVNIPLPEPCYAHAQDTIRMETPNIQPGDQYALMRLHVEEWLLTDFFGNPL